MHIKSRSKNLKIDSWDLFIQIVNIHEYVYATGTKSKYVSVLQTAETSIASRSSTVASFDQEIRSSRTTKQLWEPCRLESGEAYLAKHLVSCSSRWKRRSRQLTWVAVRCKVDGAGTASVLSARAWWRLAANVFSKTRSATNPISLGRSDLILPRCRHKSHAWSCELGRNTWLGPPGTIRAR